MRIIAAVSLVALASCTTVEQPPQANASGQSTYSAGPAACSSLNGQTVAGAVLETRWVAAAGELPAFCEASAILRPVAGSNIGVVYRLPENWNGRVLGIGGGAWLGNTTLQAATAGLRRGYATMQTNGGHTSTQPWGNEWTSNPVQAEDFSHRAIHEMTRAGKQVAAAYYGRPHQHAVYSGCSTGGRMGLMEAQRYPADYDSIIVGAPVYTLQVQTSAVLRNQVFASSRGAAGFSPEQLAMVERAALARCDGNDGLVDGIINDPASCNFDPRELMCSPERREGCLSPQQVRALDTLYTGIRASDGSWMMHPMRKGGESAWGAFNRADGAGQNADPTRGGGLMGLQPVIFGTRAVDWNAFGDADYLAVRNSPFAAMYEAKNPDLSAFFARGGRLMLWHGENDAGPSPVLSEDYVRAVLERNPRSATSRQFAYYTLPGVGHCAGGPGADQVDYLAAMEDWIERGSPPERLIGTKTDGSLTRPHCAWPTVARYRGSGDANDPASWTCVARSL